jgi:LETM1-like protein
MMPSAIHVFLISSNICQVAKLEYAKFLQKTLDEMAPKGKGRDSKSASDFVNFYQKIKTQGVGIVNNEEILKFSKLFEDDITLGNMLLNFNSLSLSLSLSLTHLSLTFPFI